MISEDIEVNLCEGILLCGEVQMRLRPKTLSVLVALIEQQGEVVSTADLRRMIWGNGPGNEAGPKQCIRELRRMLDNNAQDTGLIETVGRRGYRLTRPIPLVGDAPKDLVAASTVFCIGRDKELKALSERAAAARSGRRAMALISGEAGAGKTCLLEAFEASLSQRTPLWIARGQAIAHPGAREPYGLLMDVLTQLMAGPEGATLVRLLPLIAPSWVKQQPGHRLEAEALDRTRHNSMLREFSALMERLTRGRPGVLVLEDLHWADPSTLAWLAAWGLQRTPARLLVLGSYRDDELDRAGTLAITLGQLSRQPNCRLITLGGLDESAVSGYLAERFPGNSFPPDLAQALARRTEGHAMLVDAAADVWQAQGLVRRGEAGWQLSSTPEALVAAIAPSVRILIEAERTSRLLAEERSLLETASVAGPTFSAIDLADNRDGVEAAERQLEHLARNRRFITRAGLSQRPDGTVATRYAFRHALHHEALYDGLPAANRQGTHRRVGLRLEISHGHAAGEIAPVLADHFERGADWPRAAHYRVLSGRRAQARGAPMDAVEQFRRARDLLTRGSGTGTVKPGADRATELDALLGLGAALIVADGFTAEELREVYRRAGQLAAEVGDPATTIPVLAGLWNDHLTRAELTRAEDLALGLQALAGQAPAHMAMVAHNAVGQTRFFTGALPACAAEIAAVLEIAPRHAEQDGNVLFGEDPEVVCHQYAACVAELTGASAEAERHLIAGSARADRLGAAFGRAQMLWCGAVCARLRSDIELTRDRAEALVALCRTEAVPVWGDAGEMLAGWAQAMSGDTTGASRIAKGLSAFNAMGVRITLPFCHGLAAEVAGKMGDPVAGMHSLRQAFAIARASGERWYLAELHRLRAGLAQEAGRFDIARHALTRAETVAQAQGRIVLTT
ncbi:AAA family ATPase [Halomonas qinghailakensis]|uniref:AAA family ATPase n=1 Tax=Halomonas qinghailakensis TaxID=2937790 RepID=A0AA46YNG9_9GAMM|nr:AAA family ATPase [Halomonas sp. ZZQ-149]UYO73986.1 AAA family ATPase [Halomonas sp. ZZQ-149]